MKKTLSALLCIVLIAALLSTAVLAAELRAPTVTKHPGGETISELGTVMFVARADNDTEIDWYLCAPQGEKIPAGDIIARFPTMSVAGEHSETLTLYTVPANFNGWSAECHFKDMNGEETVTERATVTISVQLPASPTILEAPQDTWLLYGERTTLRVNAVAPEGNTVTYQWFATENNDPATATMIPEATAAEYTPPENDGTVYYCVGMRSVNNTNVSTMTYTPLTAVTYSDQPQTPEHVHSISEVWFYDEIYHWHACVGCGEVTDRSTHIYQWVETVKATARKEGSREGTCTMCGYTTTQIIPVQANVRSGKGVLVALLVVVIGLLAAGGVYYFRFLAGGKAGAVPLPRTGTKSAHHAQPKKTTVRLPKLSARVAPGSHSPKPRTEDADEADEDSLEEEDDFLDEEDGE